MTMLRFEHVTLGQRVLLGAGQALEHVRCEVERLGSPTVMVVAEQRDRTLAERVDARLLWTEIVQHVPVELAERATAAATEQGIELVVAIGGGSAIGLAKAIARSLPVTVVAVPTTFAGSEATDVWGLTDAEGKRTGVDARVLPATVIYDAELTVSLPAALAAASGLNAVAHCVDALWAPRADPLNAALAGEGLRALAGGLRAIVDDPHDLDARARTQYGCYLAAVAFASAGSAMHHKICHTLGGTFNLPHAETHAVVLPYVLAWNAPDAPDAAARIAAAFGVADPNAGLADLRTHLAAPRALRDLGLREQDVPRAAEVALAAIPPSNPRPVDSAALTALLHAAWAGNDAVSFAQGVAA